MGIITRLITLFIYDFANENMIRFSINFTTFVFISFFLYFFVPLRYVDQSALYTNTVSSVLGPMATLTKLVKTRNNDYLHVPMFVFGGTKYVLWLIYGIGEGSFPIAFAQLCGLIIVLLSFWVYYCNSSNVLNLTIIQEILTLIHLPCFFLP